MNVRVGCPRCICSLCAEERKKQAAELDRLLDKISRTADLVEAQTFYAEQVAMMRDRAPA